MKLKNHTHTHTQKKQKKQKKKKKKKKKKKNSWETDERSYISFFASRVSRIISEKLTSHFENQVFNKKTLI